MKIYTIYELKGKAFDNAFDRVWNIIENMSFYHGGLQFDCIMEISEKLKIRFNENGEIV